MTNRKKLLDSWNKSRDHQIWLFSVTTRKELSFFLSNFLKEPGKSTPPLKIYNQTNTIRVFFKLPGDFQCTPFAFPSLSRRRHTLLVCFPFFFPRPVDDVQTGPGFKGLKTERGWGGRGQLVQRWTLDRRCLRDTQSSAFISVLLPAICLSPQSFIKSCFLPAGPVQLCITVTTQDILLVDCVYYTLCLHGAEMMACVGQDELRHTRGIRP